MQEKKTHEALDITGHLKLIKAKHQAFVEWQDERTDMDGRRKYMTQCKQVRWALKCDREQWWVSLLSDMENDLRRNREGDFFKMNRLTGNKVTLEDTILDEAG